MKKYALLIVIGLCFVSCTSDDLNDDIQEVNLNIHLSETKDDPKNTD